MSWEISNVALRTRIFECLSIPHWISVKCDFSRWIFGWLVGRNLPITLVIMNIEQVTPHAHSDPHPHHTNFSAIHFSCVSFCVCVCVCGTSLSSAHSQFSFDHRLSSYSFFCAFSSVLIASLRCQSILEKMKTEKQAKKKK